MQADGVNSFAGNAKAVSGYTDLTEQKLFIYDIPVLPESWPFLFFVAGDATLNPSTGAIIALESGEVPTERHMEFKDIILRYKPLHSWAALIINFTFRLRESPGRRSYSCVTSTAQSEMVCPSPKSQRHSVGSPPLTTFLKVKVCVVGSTVWVNIISVKSGQMGFSRLISFKATISHFSSPGPLILTVVLRVLLANSSA